MLHQENILLLLALLVMTSKVSAIFVKTKEGANHCAFRKCEIIETVVVSAGKFEQRLEETTVSIEVINLPLLKTKHIHKKLPLT